MNECGIWITPNFVHGLIIGCVLGPIIIMAVVLGSMMLRGVRDAYRIAIANYRRQKAAQPFEPTFFQNRERKPTHSWHD